MSSKRSRQDQACLPLPGFWSTMRTVETEGIHAIGIASGGTVKPQVTDVEHLKKQVRKLAAGRVLAGESADVCLELGQMAGCQVRVAAGYGSLSQTPQPTARDRLIWILDGYAEIHDAAGQVTNISQGESTILTGGQAYRLVFPQLTIYVSVEAVANA